VEELHVVYLDARMQLIELRRMFVGSDMCVVVEPREIMRVALLLRSRHIALAHNHPSGDPEPSAQDLALTRRLAELCGLMGIDLVDHLVIGRPGWVSMRRDGHYQPRAGSSPAFVW
jgi:DNA repair protein RadC